MENIKFEKVKDFIDFMQNHNDRIWISYDQPRKLFLGAIDEYLTYYLEISLVNLKEQKNLLNEQEKSVFKNNRNYYELTDKKPTEYQKYFLSTGHWQDLSNYIQKNVRQKLKGKKNMLRKKCKIDYLTDGMLPKYEIGDYEKIFYLNESDNHITEKVVKNKKEFMVPLIEIRSNIENNIETIWDINIDNVINDESILKKENKIFEKSSDYSSLVFIVKTDLTVLPVHDWINKKSGFILFENVGFLAAR